MVRLQFTIDQDELLHTARLRRYPTITLTDLVLFLVPLTAIRVYVVVSEGDTLIAPFNATIPTPWSISTIVAPTTLQLRIVPSPGLIATGLASKYSITGNGEV